MSFETVPDSILSLLCSRHTHGEIRKITATLQQSLSGDKGYMVFAPCLYELRRAKKTMAPPISMLMSIKSKVYINRYLNPLIRR